MNSSDRGVVNAELDGLLSEFFRAVSSETGGVPLYGTIRALFIERGPSASRSQRPVPQ